MQQDFTKFIYFLQVDLDYRRKWDKLIEHLSVIDRDEKSGCEVVHWISHFPVRFNQNMEKNCF